MGRPPAPGRKTRSACSGDHPDDPDDRRPDADETEEVACLEGGFDSKNSGSEPQGRREADGRSDGDQGRWASPVGQERETARHGRCEGERDQPRHEPQGRPQRHGHQGEPADARDHLAQKTASGRGGLGAGGRAQRHHHSPGGQDGLKRDVRISTVAHLVGADEQVEAERIEGRDDEPRSPQRGPRPDLGRPRTPRHETRGQQPGKRDQRENRRGEGGNRHRGVSGGPAADLENHPGPAQGQPGGEQHAPPWSRGPDVFAVELDDGQGRGGAAGERGEHDAARFDGAHCCGNSECAEGSRLPAAALKGQHQRGGDQDHEAERKRDGVNA